MKAVIYCRVSSEEQVKNLSLGTQEKACREHCERNGWAVDRVFVERGESAKTTDRPELGAALAHCRRNSDQLGAFVVYAVDRLARQTGDHLSLKGALAKLGIELRSVTQAMVGDDSPESEFVETVFAAQAQLDNAQRARRTRLGMRAAAESGRWCWQPPVGYRARHDSATGRHLGLEPDPESGALVAKAFRAVAFGSRVADVAADLQADGLLGSRGLRIAEQTLHRVLRNPLYAGRIVLPRWGIDREAAHEPLVDGPTWARVQRQLGADPNREARPYRRGNPDFVLGGGFLRCESCGSPLTGTWAKGRSARYAYYRCYGCRRLCSRRDVVEGGWVSLLRRLQPSAARWASFRGMVADAYRRATGDLEQRAGRARRRIQAAAAKKARLIDAFVYDQALDERDYRERLDSLRRESAEAEVELATITESSMGLDELLDFAATTIARPADLWESDTSPQRRRILAVAICPAGATYNGEEIATAATCSLFSALGTDEPAKPRVVPPTGALSNRIPVDVALLASEIVAFRGAYGSAPCVT